MPIDNRMYDRLSDTWWNEDAFLNVLKTGLNPPRFGYMCRILIRDVGLNPGELRVLDVGCGGGLLAEEFASLGCAVTGVDPSHESLQAARTHATEQGLEINYREGTGEDLPFEDAAFRVVYCCHVLEHVKDLRRTIGEIARVLEPGGLFMYDTINRTRRSKLLMIKVAQDWHSTAWAEPDLHAFDMFIRPEELEAHLQRAGLEVRDRVGLAPANGMAAFKAMWDRAHGKISYAQMGARLGMVECRDTSSSYAGYATKQADRADAPLPPG